MAAVKQFFQEFADGTIDLNDYDFGILTALILYMPVIFTGMKYMGGSTRFKETLRIPFFLWNVCLSIYSGWVFYSLTPYVYDHFIVQGKGFDTIVCIDTKEQAKFVLTTFGFSKLVEFGDTIFLIFRGNTPEFLHWYHHISIALFSWRSYNVGVDTVLWSSFSNSFIHTIMYMYFALMAIKIRVPTILASILTTLQIVQMVLGFYSFYNYQYCDPKYDTLLYGFAVLIYMVYGFYFLEFFVEKYFLKKKKKAKKQE